MSRDPDPEAVECYEETTPDIDFDITDQNGVALPSAAITEMKLTVKQRYTKAVCAGRDQQDVLNVNNVSVTDGHAVWALQVPDTTLLNRELPTEPRWVHFRWRYLSAGQPEFGDYEFMLNVHRRDAHA